MARVLIIGYGNPLRSDDGFGWHAARKLAARLQSQDVEVVSCHQLTPDLAEQVGRADLAIFIDAAARDSLPARLTCEKIEAGADEKRAGVSPYTHSVTPGALLHWAAELYGRSPEAYYIWVTGEAFEAGESLSRALRAMLPRLLSHVEALIRSTSALTGPTSSAGAGALP
jgi:hydrogenase maturation protease